jgi:hypothetical protein
MGSSLRAKRRNLGGGCLPIIPGVPRHYAPSNDGDITLINLHFSLQLICYSKLNDIHGWDARL